MRRRFLLRLILQLWIDIYGYNPDSKVTDYMQAELKWLDENELEHVLYLVVNTNKLISGHISIQKMFNTLERRTK